MSLDQGRHISAAPCLLIVPMIPPREPPPPDFDEPEVEVPNALGETYNAAEPAEVKKQVKRQAQRRRDSAEIWQSILATKEGRAELWKVLVESGAFAINAGTSRNGSYDPVLTGYLHGQKDLGQYLFHMWLGYDREGALQMLLEHQDKAVEASKAKRAKKTPTSGFTATKTA